MWGLCYTEIMAIEKRHFVLLFCLILIFNFPAAPQDLPEHWKTWLDDEIDPNIRIPYSDQFTFGVERTLMKNTTLSLTVIRCIYENPNRQINAYGTVSLAWGFVLTPRFTFQSGWNWTRYITGPRWAGRPPIYVEDRGTQKLPAQISLDLRLEKLFTLTGRMRIGIILDAFNILNRGVETEIESNIADVNFGLATSVCDSRYFRVGLRFFF
jgi:hypothetical protein